MTADIWALYELNKSVSRASSVRYDLPAVSYDHPDLLSYSAEIKCSAYSYNIKKEYRNYRLGLINKFDMEDSQNSIIINTIHDEITALRSRELKYNKKSITAISSPAHRSEEDHCCRLSPVNVVAIDRICTSSFNDAESRLKVCEWMYKVSPCFS